MTQAARVSDGAVERGTRIRRGAGRPGRIGSVLGSVACALLMSLPVAAASPDSSDLPPIEVEVAVEGARLLATSKPADFGLGDDGGIRAVDLRIVDELVVTLGLRPAADVLLAGPPRLCLVGPLWNPLDAGLSDRCWGEPDLTQVAADRLARGPDGEYLLSADAPVALTLPLSRGETRCDYPPGAWALEVSLEPVGAGSLERRMYLPDVPVDVPLEDRGPLAYLASHDTRFCSYAAAIFLQQGPPAIDRGSRPQLGAPDRIGGRRPKGAAGAPAGPARP